MEQEYYDDVVVVVLVHVVATATVFVSDADRSVVAAKEQGAVVDVGGLVATAETAAAVVVPDLAFPFVSPIHGPLPPGQRSL